MVVQREGDMNIMGGRFQEQYLHEVPPISKWPELLDEFRSELEDWEIEAVEEELELFSNRLEEDLKTRYNTL